MQGISILRQRRFSAPAVLAAGIVFLAAGRVGAATVFSDTFANGSTIATGTYPSVSSNSTGYAIAASKGQSPAPSINANDLKMGIASTSSGLEQAQALFTTTPVNLVNTGDSVDLQVNFTNTGILVTGSSTSGQLDFGLYNSGSTAPKTDLQASGLSSTLTADATGGAAGWTGYAAQMFFTGGTSKIITRPAQTGADNTNQDLIGNNFSASNSFHNPAGTALASSSTPSPTLTAGDKYTEDLKITLTGANTYEIDTTLFDNTTSTQASSQSVTGVTGANFLNGFDGLAFGWRETGSTASAMDVSSVSVTTASATPEPASLALLGLGGLALLRRRK